VTSRVEQLAARRRLLLARSALERETLKFDAVVIGDTLSTIDRMVSVVQRLRRSPLVIAAAVVGLFVFRRYPATAWVMRGIAVGSAARRIGASLRQLAAEPAAPGRRA
jgi:hypothetical protein